MNKPSKEFIQWYKENDISNITEGMSVLKNGTLYSASFIEITKDNNPQLHLLFQKLKNILNEKK
jgi:hypothetical protein